MMKLKQLKMMLSSLDSFHSPKVKLEQYATPVEIASEMLYCAEQSYGDLSGSLVLDLGCGAGVLSIGATLLGANAVVSVDCDSEALDIVVRNCESLEIDSVDVLLADVTSFDFRLQRAFDTVILNPPFGTKQNAGLDITFLERACAYSVAGGAVYSLHKSSTRDFVLKQAQLFSNNGTVVVLSTIRWPLQQTMKFHKRKNVDIEVDLIRIQIGSA